MFAQTKRNKKVFIQLFSKSWRGYGASSPVFSVSFVSFSLRFWCQRKATKPFCYQRSFDAFSFETIGTKEKALQKENAVMRSRRAGATFEKVDKTSHKASANISINPNL